MRSTFLFLTYLFWSVMLVAQQDAENEVEGGVINVEETTKSMSKGLQPAFKIDIDRLNAEKAKDWWSRHIRKEAKTRVEMIGSEVIMKDGVIESISQHPLNIYALFIPYPDYVEWYSFYEMDSVFLTKEENEVEYLSAKQFARDFAIEAYRKAMEIEIKDEDKKLADIQKELSKLRNEMERQKDIIENAEREMDANKDGIKTVEISLNVAQDKLKGQKQETASLDSEDYIKVSEKKERQIEREINRIQREKEQLLREKDNTREAIADAKKKIPEIQSLIDEQQAALASQQETVSRLEQQLAGID